MTDEKPGRQIDQDMRSELSPETILHRYEALMQSIDGIVWEASIENGTFKYTFVNDQAESILGYPVSQWFDEPDFWINHLHPADREQTINYCRTSIKNEEDHKFECRVIAADGRIVWLRDIVTVNTGDDGVVYLRGVMVDITARIAAADELRSSEGRMRALLEQIPAIVWSTDRDLRFTHMAGRALPILQVPETRNVGLSLQEYFQTDDPNFNALVAHRRALQGESLSYEIEWMGYIFDAYVEPLRNALGEIVGCIGIGLDVTGRKRAEEKALKERRLTDAMFESLPGVFYLYNRDGKYLRWNKNLEEVTGYNSEELARMHPLDKIPGDERALAYERVAEVFDKGKSSLEAHLMHRNGILTPYYLTGKRVTIDEQDCLIGMGIDITERKNAEENMLREKRLIEAMFESLPGVFYLITKEGRYLRWNKNHEEVTGYTAEEMAVIHPTAFVMEEERPVLVERMNEVFETGQSTMTTDLRAKNGTLTPYFFTGRLVVIDNQECIIGMGIDITERVRAEDEKRRLIYLLGERVKELTMLHKTARILQQDNKAVPEMLSEIVTLIAPAWQYPEITAGRITLGDLILETDRFAKTPWMQSADLEVDGISGKIEVAYLEERPDEDEGPFLAEERTLIDSLSEIISSTIDRRYAHEELRESQRRFSDTLTNLEMMAVMTDTAGTIQFCNDHLLSVTGWRREEVTGKNWFDMFLPEYEKEKVGQLLGNGGPEHSIAPHFENDIVTRAGDIRVVKWTNTTLRDLNGNVTGVAALGNDVTEREHFERELKKSEERYRNLVENAHDIIYTQDLEGNYTSMNKAGAQITGYTLEEVLTMNAEQIIAPEFYDRARQMIASKLAGEKETVYELEIIAKDGRRIAVEVNTRLVYQDGVPIGIQGIARDVTERHHLEEQLRQAQKMEAVGRLAGGIAHDFNNMLTVINGYSDLILKKVDTLDPVRPRVEEIKKAGETSASLTHQLLAFSRKQVLQPKVIDLNTIVSNTKKMLQRLIGEDIKLTTILGPKLGNIKADPGQIEQVIMNLAVNSRDAMPRGGRLTIKTERVSLKGEQIAHQVLAAPGDYILLTVSDSGPGMDGETLQHIFEPFFTTKEIGKGTGLGLATVYGIVKQSGGYITVDSELGRGTAFKIYLPVIEEVTQDYQMGPELQVSLEGSETILLIEDEGSVRRLTHQLLKSYGYEVLEATSADEALSLGGEEARPIQLLISDVVMPEMSGPDLAEKMKEHWPNMKVLYISGYTDDAIVVHHGILDPEINFLQKPFSPDALARKVREVLGEK